MNMNNCNKRLREAYNYARFKYKLKTQLDFADAIKITRPALSAALNGNPSYLTKNLFTKICAAFPGVFNLDWFLTGEGEMLAPSPEPRPTMTAMTPAESSLVELYARLIADVEQLRRDLADEIERTSILNDRYKKVIERIERENLTDQAPLIAADPIPNPEN